MFHSMHDFRQLFYSSATLWWVSCFRLWPHRSLRLKSSLNWTSKFTSSQRPRVRPLCRSDLTVHCSQQGLGLIGLAAGDVDRHCRSVTFGSVPSRSQARRRQRTHRTNAKPHLFICQEKNKHAVVPVFAAIMWILEVTPPWKLSANTHVDLWVLQRPGCPAAPVQFQT